MTFEHPRWWRYSFWICVPAFVATLVATTWFWLSVSPVIAAVNGAVLLGCIAALWNAVHHIGHRVSTSAVALSFAPYLGSSRELRWDDVGEIREFTVLGWTARRRAVMLEGRNGDWVAFFHDIDRFDDLRATVADHARSAVTKGAPPWTTRLARLGTF